MNKQELIESIENLTKLYRERKYVAIDDVLNLVNKLDEPKKVKVPQFVAEWYKKHKNNLDYEIWDYFRKWSSQEQDDFYNWVNRSKESIVTLSNMHQFGYEVEEEPKYIVKLKNNTKEVDYLVDTANNGFRFYSTIYTNYRTHTRKELEEAGFGWVFDCPGIEIEEVE